MSQFFRDYKEAHTAAVTLARAPNREVGLEKYTEYTTKGFRVFGLPNPENRQGFELRCQVVRPSDPI